MSLISISEAAKLVGRDRKTLYRAIKEGRLSVSQNASGAKQVDIAELARVFGSFPVARDSGDAVTMPHDETQAATDATTSLKAKIAALEAENTQLRERIEELRERIEDKDKHIEDMRHTVRLLEHSQSQKKGRWWPWPR